MYVPLCGLQRFSVSFESFSFVVQRAIQVMVFEQRVVL